MSKESENTRKIGMMTCFLDNCGACLQAYSLQKTIQSMGFVVEIIKFTEPGGYYKATFKNSSKTLDFLRRVKSKSFRRYYNSGMYRTTSFVLFRKRYLQFSEEEYSSYEKLKSATFDYDAFVCGSDQIWNPTFYKKCNPAYYLAFVPDEITKVAYEPSIGIIEMTFENISIDWTIFR